MSSGDKHRNVTSCLGLLDLSPAGKLLARDKQIATLKNKPFILPPLKLTTPK
jgi:hypothetical protein